MTIPTIVSHLCVSELAPPRLVRVHAFCHIVRFLLKSGISAASLVVMLAFSGPAHGEYQQPKSEAVKGSKVVFKAIEIKPSPDGKGYEGRFAFINKGDSDVMVPGFREPLNSRFEPRFPKYQRLEEGTWVDVPLGYCGTGPQEYPMKPGISYEFQIGLFRLAPWGIKKEDSPFTGRVGVGGFWSDPFVIDRKKDEVAGKFEAVRTEHFKKVRNVFAKTGFKEELLVGDDFHRRLLQSLMKRTTAQEAAASFQPFIGAMDVVPSIQLDGTVRIDFESDIGPEGRPQYRGWFSLNPRGFSPRWFQLAVDRNVKVTTLGERGLRMRLDDGKAFDGPLYLSIIYEQPKGSNPPSQEAGGALFRSMLDELAQWLRE